MSDDIEERMRTLAVKPDALEQAMRAQFARSQDASNAAVFPLDEGRPPTAVTRATARLHKAALVVGKHFHDETDASWSDVHEYEAAALDLYKAVRAEQEGT